MYNYISIAIPIVTLVLGFYLGRKGNTNIYLQTAHEALCREYHDLVLEVRTFAHAQTDLATQLFNVERFGAATATPVTLPPSVIRPKTVNEYAPEPDFEMSGGVN